MGNRQIALVSALAGFAGGLAVGMIMTSRQGLEFRAAVQERVRRGARHLDERLKQVEGQLQELERTIHQASENVAARIQRAAKPEAEEQNWDVTHGEVARELPHLPRGK